MNSDDKYIYTVYYFGVINEGKEEKKFKTPLWLPKRASSFAPQNGFSKEEILLADDGSLYLEKIFQPGLNLLGINFKVPYFNRLPIEFKLPFDLSELNFATPKDSQMTLLADGFTEGLSEMLSQGNYQGILKTNLKQGDTFALQIKGLPRPSYYSWYFFSVSASLLLLSLAIFLYRSYFIKREI